MPTPPTPFRAPLRRARDRAAGAALLPFLVPLLLAAVPAAPLAGQEDGQEDGAEAGPGLFFESVEVNVVNVEVFVTDKQGNRVTGLTRDDFEIYEDGRPAEITNFYAVERGRPVAVEEPGVAPEPSARPPAPPQQVPEEQRLHLILYVDNVNIRPQNRRWVMDAVRRFLFENVDPGDRVMLVSYDRSLNLRQTFTEDPRLIEAALDEVGKATAAAVARDADRRRALDEIEAATSRLQAISSARAHANFVRHEMSFTISALQDLMSTLAGVRGRKAILYVSDGLPMVAAEDLFIAVEERFGLNSGRTQAFQFDLSRRFHELAAHANGAGVTLYALDAEGLRIDSSVSAAERGRSFDRGMTVIESTRVANLQAPLRLLTDATGGLAILNTNAVDAGLDRVAEDFETYYSLGYRPPSIGDGRYHSIEVKVRGKGLRVRHRKGYRDRSRDVRLKDGSVAALRFGFEHNPLGARLELGRPSPQEKDRYVVPVRLEIPIGNLTLVPRSDGHHGRIQVTFEVMDAEGDRAPIPAQPAADLVIPEEELDEALEKHYTYSLGLLMREGRHRVAVGIRDELGSESSFLRSSIDVGG